MALDVSAVRAGLRTLLENRLGGEVQVATAPDQITPPCLLIGMPELEYHKAFKRGLDRMELPVFAIFPRAHDQAATDRSDAWISGEGSESFVTIVGSDKTLGGTCQASQVTGVTSDFSPAAVGELPTYEFNIEVYG